MTRDSNVVITFTTVLLDHEDNLPKQSVQMLYRVIYDYSYVRMEFYNMEIPHNNYFMLENNFPTYFEIREIMIFNGIFVFHRPPSQDSISILVSTPKVKH